MNHTKLTVSYGVLVEDELEFSLAELSRVCRADVAVLVALVDEGVLTPEGNDPLSWRFAGVTLLRARTALRLVRDLELSATGTALVLDLLGERDALRAQLRRLGVMPSP